MSHRAYQQVAQRAESPRQTEYRLFGEVTRALMEAADIEATEVATRMTALDWNRRLWATLANDCAQSDNALPEVVRAQIISLSLFVNRHTSAVVRREAPIDLLIEVNRSIMQGLAPEPSSAVPTRGQAA